MFHPTPIGNYRPKLYRDLGTIEITATDAVVGGECRFAGDFRKSVVLPVFLCLIDTFS